MALGTTGFVLVAAVAAALVGRRWKWLIPVTPIVGLFFWDAWDRSGLGAVYSLWIVVFLSAGLRGRRGPVVARAPREPDVGLRLMAGAVQRARLLE